MKSYILHDHADMLGIRSLLDRLPRPTVVNIEEHMGIPAIRSTTCLWQVGDDLIAVAYIDTYNNLYFEITPEQRSDELEQEIMDWGLTCVRKRNAETNSAHTLDASCSAEDLNRLRFLEKFGFVREPVRSLKYSRSLDKIIEEFPFPTGFTVRPVTGEDEVDALVALHRAAFGTENMTVEERLAIMRTSNYIPELDLVVVAPDGQLSAFCICEMEMDGQTRIGHTDPVGTHPRYQRLGLGKALISVGLHALKERGAAGAQLGTSSENIPMQKLAQRLGFICVGETLWFSKSAV